MDYLNLIINFDIMGNRGAIKIIEKKYLATKEDCDSFIGETYNLMNGHCDSFISQTNEFVRQQARQHEKIMPNMRTEVYKNDVETYF
jgi:hypothetical protein